MDNSLKQVKLLLRAIYLLFVLLIIYIGSIFYIYFNPKNANKEIKERISVWKLKSLITDIPDDEFGKNVKYGYQIITNTTQYIGPLAEKTEMRFAGNNLSCNNCHLDAGRKIGSGSFVGITNRFPQFRGRENKMGTLEERINGCLERSMNGRIMTNNNEMQAIIAYMEWLSEGVPLEIEKKYKGYVKIKIPNFKADVKIGRELYNIKCTHCHLENGMGIEKKQGNKFNGYIYPPLGGNDTYNDGAGMNRVITAAQFIKGNMPFGASYDSPQVTDEEAYHIAAYINTFSRPEKKNKEVDFPDKKLKPVSTPYGPWVDNFSSDQHKFGPFPPIISYYKKKYDLTKTK